MDQLPLRKNPSRVTCEEQIKRILMTEVLEQGTNHHFKTAADFMKYFESLYPAGPGLTKQVQRAVKHLDMPKNAKGYFIINKTKEQIAQEDELTAALSKTDASILDVDLPLEVVFLKTDVSYRTYLKELILNSDIFQGKYETLLDSSHGLLFLTQNKNQLRTLIESLINKTDN